MRLKNDSVTVTQRMQSGNEDAPEKPPGKPLDHQFWLDFTEYRPDLDTATVPNITSDR
jgi:hypothetical protein